MTERRFPAFTQAKAKTLCDAVAAFIQEHGNNSRSAIDWQHISGTVKVMGATECKSLWKYIAYGVTMDDGDTDISSDEDETYFEPKSAIDRFITFPGEDGEKSNRVLHSKGSSLIDKTVEVRVSAYPMWYFVNAKICRLFVECTF